MSDEQTDRPAIESAVLVPALEVGQSVHDLRMKYDPSAAAGVPPHVTLMFPFVHPPDLSEQVIAALQALISATNAFPFSLTRVREFEHGVIYLEPEPSEPFARLTTEISQQFGMLPYGGEFGDESVAHLTVAVVEEARTRQLIVSQLSGVVPIAVKAEEAWLMVGSSASSWKLVRQILFRD